MHPMFPFPNIVFKHSVALIYHLFHIQFGLKYNLLYSHLSFTLHVSAVFGDYQVSILLKLLHCMSKFLIACERDISLIKTYELTFKYFP
jgi:hypothetical protein